MARLILATNNAHKVEELRALLQGAGVEIAGLENHPQLREIPEEGETLEENALQKARTVHRVVGGPVLADDTGLEVGYLINAPGVRSSRYAGEKATYADNCRKLLAELRGVAERRRGARFRCVLAFIDPAGKEHLAEGTVRGTILESPRGAGGFGYDPVFVPEGHRKTFAEMTAAEKNALSHRALAAAALRPLLERAFGRP
jgi:XTP/dITP diphosphohydrolase